MDRTTTETAVKTCIHEISTRLDQAATIAKAADLCASAGTIAKAVEIALDIEQLAYEISRLLDAASLLNRIANESDRSLR